jgi:hypothetical protein
LSAIGYKVHMNEMASHTVEEGMYATRLHGGPWDGKEVGVRDIEAQFVTVNGPRYGNHTVWITHIYQRRGDRYEFVSTETIPISHAAWLDLKRNYPGRNENGPGG